VYSVKLHKCSVGLTGGIGCGKSSALAAFAACGVRVLDTDGIVRGLLTDDGDVRGAIRGAFGYGVMAADGSVDRGAVARIVFDNPQLLRRLEDILHPRVRAVWMQAVAENQGALVVEIPLLFEKNLGQFFDWTICLACSPDLQIERLLARGMSREQIFKRLEQQLPLEEKVRRADVVIFNDGTKEHLEQQVRLLCRTRLGMEGV